MARRTQPDRGPGYWLDQQRKFMAERGSNAAGYQFFYANLGHGVPTPPEQIQAIYEADLGVLRDLERRAAMKGTRS